MVTTTTDDDDYSDNEFEWSLQKEQENLAKHGVSFELARHVFDDPAHASGDGYDKDGEVRYDTIGRVTEHLVLRVTHTYRAHRIRIISARKGDAKERRSYASKVFR